MVDVKLTGRIGDYKAGTIVPVSEKHAALLVQAGLAEIIPEPSAPEKKEDHGCSL